MQIHEITRRNINEGPLKNVATTPVNFGQTTVAMPQQSVAPSKVSFAPNMMPKAAPAAASAPGTNLAVVPQTTAVANTPGTGVATVPTGGAVAATPRTGQVAPAANRVRPSQSDPNVIDVDAKDITNRQALASPTTQPTVTAPVPQPATAAKPVGLTPADTAKLRAQDKSNSQVRPTTQAAPTQPDTSSKFKTVKGAQAPVAAAPGKAGFVRNAAEYFANKTMNAAGIPLDQQGQYHPGGHMAASQNKGIASIAKAENDIATEISKEWAQLGLINNVKDEKLDPNNIVQAAQALNTRKLQLNTNNIVANVKKMAPQYRRLRNLYKKPAVRPAAAAAAPAISVGRGQKPEDLNDPAMAQLLATAKKQGKI